MHISAPWWISVLYAAMGEIVPSKILGRGHGMINQKLCY